MLKITKSQKARLMAIKNANASVEEIGRALGDSYVLVRSNAASHPKATSDQIFKAIKDKNPHVRHCALYNHSLTDEHIEVLLNDDMHMLRALAALHQAATPQQRNRIENHPDSLTRATFRGQARIKRQSPSPFQTITSNSRNQGE